MESSESGADPWMDAGTRVARRNSDVSQGAREAQRMALRVALIRILRYMKWLINYVCFVVFSNLTWGAHLLAIRRLARMLELVAGKENG